jgi:aldose 1-epimerase
MPTSVERRLFGEFASGERVDCFTLVSEVLRVEVITLGACLVSLQAPDATGKLAHVVLGSYDLCEYTREDKAYLGAVCGRFANRITNASITIDDVAYPLSANENGKTTLHGGAQGFDTRNWSAEIVPDGVRFTLISSDGDQGFPGTLQVSVTYLLEDSRLRIFFAAQTDKATVVNLTQHSYFNLDGEGHGNIRDHALQVAASEYLPVNADFLPTGEILRVDQTPFDLRSEKLLGNLLTSAEPQLRHSRGYNHAFILDGKDGDLKLAARLIGQSGRTLTLFTTEPSLQVYSGGYLSGAHVGFSGKRYDPEAGLALEAQRYPDSPNHPKFPSTLLLPGETYKSETIFEFSQQ